MDYYTTLSLPFESGRSVINACAPAPAASELTCLLATDREILGHSRKIMVYLPWLAMMAISVSEYAYGSAEDTLSEAHHWTQSDTFWILSVWVFFQAGIAFPAGWLRERGLLTARRQLGVVDLQCRCTTVE